MNKLFITLAAIIGLYTGSVKANDFASEFQDPFFNQGKHTIEEIIDCKYYTIDCESGGKAILSDWAVIDGDSIRAGYFDFPATYILHFIKAKPRTKLRAFYDGSRLYEESISKKMEKRCIYEIQDSLVKVSLFIKKDGNWVAKSDTKIYLNEKPMISFQAHDYAGKCSLVDGSYEVSMLADGNVYDISFKAEKGHISSDLSGILGNLADIFISKLHLMYDDTGTSVESAKINFLFGLKKPAQIYYNETNSQRTKRNSLSNRSGSD